MWVLAQISLSSAPAFSSMYFCEYKRSKKNKFQKKKLQPCNKHLNSWLKWLLETDHYSKILKRLYARGNNICSLQIGHKRKCIGLQIWHTLLIKLHRRMDAVRSTTKTLMQWKMDSLLQAQNRKIRILYLCYVVHCELYGYRWFLKHAIESYLYGH